MRKDYVEGSYQIAWGFDHVIGFFVQVFASDDKIIVDLDQSELLQSFGFAYSDLLTREKMIEVLSKYSSKALEDFLAYEQEKLPIPLKGYKTDENGFYKDYEILNTYKDLFQFLDSVEKYYIITDIFDCLVYSRQKRRL